MEPNASDLLIVSWMIMLFALLIMGHIFIGWGEYKTISDSARKGGLFNKVQFAYYSIFPPEIMRIVAFPCLAFIILFAGWLVVLPINNSINIKWLIIVSYFVNIIIQDAVLFLLTAFKRKHFGQKEFGGPNRALLTLMITKPPMMAYRIFMGLITFFNLAQIYKIWNA